MYRIDKYLDDWNQFDTGLLIQSINRSNLKFVSENGGLS